MLSADFLPQFYQGRVCKYAARFGYGERFKPDQTVPTNLLPVETMGTSGRNVNTRLDGWSAFYLWALSTGALCTQRVKEIFEETLD
ncbi:hypothetical protein AVEN_192454-1 [Araneus ventricosus]|uniref:Uncharacterized protein n=1 Tax=Araneus ventricosus TaxID=182803 RepID=A0A4Y2NVR1_ARAVE|nr:hypothetical protein AVEN_192454-1 [Araneus ventricosus]